MEVKLIEEYFKIKEFLFNFDCCEVVSIDRLFEIMEDKRQLTWLIDSYGDDVSVSASPEFAVFREKYLNYCQ